MMFTPYKSRELLQVEGYKRFCIYVRKITINPKFKFPVQLYGDARKFLTKIFNVLKSILKLFT